MQLPRRFSFVCLLTWLFCVAASTGATDEINPDQHLIPTPPQELHEYLAAQKAQMLDLARRPVQTDQPGLAAQAEMDVTYYRLDLKIDEVTSMLDGRVTIRSRALVDGFTQPILNFLSNMDIDSVFNNGVNNYSWTHNNNFLIVDLPSMLSSGEEFELDVFYHGYPADGFFYTERDGVPTYMTLSQPYGARGFWPCKDLPDDKADSVDIIVEVDSDLYVSANGVLRDSVNHGTTTTYHWHEGHPIATYLVSICATDYGHFREWYTYGPADTDSMPVDFFPYPELYSEALTSWPETVQMIDFFADIFGEYPFVDEKYGMTHFMGGGAMEHQTNTSATNGPFGFDRFLIAHELAHQWWGDYITCDTWHHIWLNEGFASYAEALYAEHLGGREVYHYYMSQMEFRDGGTIYVQDTTSGAAILHSRVYDKGAWVLHMLRGYLGDQTFFEILQAYYQQPQLAYAGATTEDFRDVAEAVSGLELDAFFEQWIYDQYYPSYRFGFVQDPNTNQARVYITQFQESSGIRPLFVMPVQLQFHYSGGGDTTVTVMNDQVDQTFVIDLPAPVDGMSFDPDNWILKNTVEENGPILQRDELVIDDTGGNANQRPDPGETDVRVTVTMTNTGADALDVSVLVSTPYSEIVFTNNQVIFGDMLHGQQVNNQTQPIIFDVAADLPPTIVDFIFTYSAFGGSYTFVDTILMDVGQPQVVIVDDDQAHQFNYEEYFTDFLYSLRIPHVVWGRDTLPSPPADTLNAYPIVLWFTGDSRAEVLSTQDVSNLKTLLDSGGRLFLTGQDIAEDLADDADSTFLRDYLHLRFAPGNPLLLAEGVTGDPIGDGQTVALGGPGGASNQNSPDILQLVDTQPKPVYYYYNSDDVAGMRLAKDDYRVVFFGFGCEGIADDLPGFTKREEVFTRVFGWLTADDEAYTPGDLDAHNGVNAVDVIYLANYVYRGEALPGVLNAADVNTDCLVNPIDVVILVNYVYRNLGELYPGCAQ